MNIRHAALALGLGLAFASTAGAVTIGYSPRTGDVWIDTHLGDVNRYGYSQRDYFADDVVNQFGAPRYLVNDLLGPRHWQPGDVYYACALAYQARRPCKDVADLYEGNRGRGWGVIAQSMGIKPGSREFFALKDGLGKAHGRYEAHAKAHGKPMGNDASGHSGEHGQGNGNKNKGKGNGKDHGNGNGNGHGNNGGGRG
jgi:hypothetical protein